MTSTPTPRRSRKASALLATTAVLGIATVATLATWTITEYVNGQFKTGVQSAQGAIEGSADGTTFAYHSSVDETLSLNWGDVNLTTLAGNDTVAAPYAIRTTEGTTSNTRIRVKTELTSGELNGLTYSVYGVDDLSDCHAGITSASAGVRSVIGEKVALGGPLAKTFDLAPATASAPGAATNLCVAVNVPDTAAQDTATSVDFTFTAQ
ncbi:hypothetical protein [Leifsonia aquatica]|uniref:hypothetical protein n=1 Tax=Leifsonia aquatica TaxID=144185 RepID=UPI0004692FDA|nr:hypothetical protein [Leifsonia aquatica]